MYPFTNKQKVLVKNLLLPLALEIGEKNKFSTSAFNVSSLTSALKPHYS